VWHKVLSAIMTLCKTLRRLHRHAAPGTMLVR